jgi:hypothetical protein
MTVISGRSTSADYINKYRPQGHVADHVNMDMWQTMSARLRQQGHMAQSDNDKCQVDSTFQVRANHKSE